VPTVVPDGQASDLIGTHFRERLASLHASEPQAGVDAILHQIDGTTRISPEEGTALTLLATRVTATRTLEVGLGYGFSTAYLLAALANRQQTEAVVHVAIDPFQFTDWNGIGITTAMDLVAASPWLSDSSFQCIHERSDIALAGLLKEGRVFDLAFIDGYHRFDDVLVDFTMAAQMCPMGGVIVLHDMWLPGIASVAGFIRSNRADFAEVQTGCENLFAVTRVGDDVRNWDHFVPFATEFDK
jgi:predicted O-methyltransferase YrrM